MCNFLMGREGRKDGREEQGKGRKEGMVAEGRRGDGKRSSERSPSFKFASTPLVIAECVK